MAWVPAQAVRQQHWEDLTVLLPHPLRLLPRLVSYRRTSTIRRHRRPEVVAGVSFRFPADTRGSGAVGGVRDIGGGCGGGEEPRGDAGAHRRRQVVRGLVLRMRGEQGGVHSMGAPAAAPAVPRRGAGRRLHVRLHGPAGDSAVPPSFGGPSSAALPIQYYARPLRHPLPGLVFLGLVCIFNTVDKALY